MRQDSSTPSAALYTRVSSDQQAGEERVSLDEQTRDIEAYASSRGVLHHPPLHGR